MKKDFKTKYSDSNGHSKCPYCGARPKPCEDAMHVSCCGCSSNDEFYFTGTPVQWEEQVKIMQKQKEEDEEQCGTH